MTVKDRLRAAIDKLSEEEAATVLIVLLRGHDDIANRLDRQRAAHAAMYESMASAEELADDD